MSFFSSSPCRQNKLRHISSGKKPLSERILDCGGLHTWFVVIGTAPGWSMKNCLSSRRSANSKYKVFFLLLSGKSFTQGERVNTEFSSHENDRNSRGIMPELRNPLNKKPIQKQVNNINRRRKLEEARKEPKTFLAMFS